MSVSVIIFLETNMDRDNVGTIIEDNSPNLEDELRREDSDRSWSSSQGPSQGTTKNKDKLFLVSLGTIMSLFR
jgi:large exoprotein involved in heme utilization and adhesion